MFFIEREQDVQKEIDNGNEVWYNNLRNQEEIPFLTAEEPSSVN